MPKDCSCTECALRELVKRLEAKVKDLGGVIARLSCKIEELESEAELEIAARDEQKVREGWAKAEAECAAYREQAERNCSGCRDRADRIALAAQVAHLRGAFEYINDAMHYEGNLLEWRGTTEFFDFLNDLIDTPLSNHEARAKALQEVFEAVSNSRCRACSDHPVLVAIGKVEELDKGEGK